MLQIHTRVVKAEKLLAQTLKELRSIHKLIEEHKREAEKREAELKEKKRLKQERKKREAERKKRKQERKEREAKLKQERKKRKQERKKRKQERKELLEKWKEEGNKCIYCGKHADTREHLIPKSVGGKHTWPACLACNQERACKRPKEYPPLQKFIRTKKGKLAWDLAWKAAMKAAPDAHKWLHA